jgi:hypothetical protein
MATRKSQKSKSTEATMPPKKKKVKLTLKQSQLVYHLAQTDTQRQAGSAASPLIVRRRYR